MGASRLSSSAVVPVSRGGTGLQALAAKSVLSLDGSQNISLLAPLNPGRVIKSLSNAPVLVHGDNIIQVVSASYSTPVYITDQTNWTPTGLSCTITPLFSNSQIIVMINQTGVGKISAHNSWLGLSLWRNSINLGQFAWPLGFTGEANPMSPGTSAHMAVDNPATTSTLTYSTKGIANGNTSGQLTCQWAGITGSSTMVLMELAG